MYQGKRFLAIIPARSGSKGLRHKNIKLLNNKPMMAYTIEAAVKSQIFDEIIVSTDDEHYAEIARQYGASVPMLRPKQLAQDQTTTIEVVTYIIDELKKQGNQYDYIMILQPTSPLRDENDVLGSVELLFEKSANAIVSMCEVDHPIKWAVELIDNQCLDGVFISVPCRRQEEKITYRLNGAIYLIDIVYYLKYQDFYKKDCYAYIMEKNKSIDIDDIYDFKYAEVLINKDV
ncbi:MAG: N-acylneuraminate cytidylyltransferase [Anaerocolumna sp.]|jgi:CMP-N-acetylneuraminic acid synthetase|nr:N-acylneuraminate cytidylyltransferase [Anaerocolumna sp.]